MGIFLKEILIGWVLVGQGRIFFIFYSVTCFSFHFINSGILCYLYIQFIIYCVLYLIKDLLISIWTCSYSVVRKCCKQILLKFVFWGLSSHFLRKSIEISCVDKDSHNIPFNQKIKFLTCYLGQLWIISVLDTSYPYW